jgi:capsular exopolysaccharide synthesis family protein
MPAHLVPADPNNGVPTNLPPGGATWAPAPAPQQGSTLNEQLMRTWSAIRRYKWLIVAIMAIGISAGFALTRIAKPNYTVNGSIMLARSAGGQGPITSPGLISDPDTWIELVRSFIVLDQVVQRLGLHVTPGSLADTALLRDLMPSAALRPGSYELRVDAGRTNYSLVQLPGRTGGEEVVVERGVLGDSIGRVVGFQWQPEPTRFAPGAAVAFNVMTPRDAAIALGRDLKHVPVSQNSNLLRLSMDGENPVLIARKMNTLLDQFAKEAARLKRNHLTAVRTTIEDQIGRANERLRAAESSLETFKVNTITLPSENTVVAAGAQMSLNPVFNSFFNDNVTHKSIQRDRQALEAIFAAAERNGGRLSIEGLRALPPINQGNSPLLAEIANLETKQALLRQLEQRYTDEYRPVAALKQEIAALETQTIPMLANQALDQIRLQEADLRQSIDGQATELRQIPERTIEEASRQRDVNIADNIYVDLQQRYSTARLAELSVIPDVEVFDTATVPSRPSSDTDISIFIFAIALSLVLAIFAAWLLDRTDRRFRYPEQATRDLGLDILSGIPTIRNPRNASARLQEASQLVEAFRSLSLTLRSAFDGVGPVVLTVSSPGPGDGKSFVSANLAMALADGGYRTLVIDGDIRRGALHSVFAPATQTPGLTDYLAGETTLSELIRPTSHPGLFLIPCGRRRRNGPELLAGEGMVDLLRDMRQQFDAVIVDTAPLGAGIDPFALGVATGAMLLVLRSGETDRKLAAAKLEVLDRMPVRVLGAVLNDIGENPQFRYYYYLEGYGALETAVTEEAALIGSGSDGGGRGR